MHEFVNEKVSGFREVTDIKWVAGERGLCGRAFGVSAADVLPARRYEWGIEATADPSSLRSSG